MKRLEELEAGQADLEKRIAALEAQNPSAPPAPEGPPLTELGRLPGTGKGQAKPDC